MVLLLCSFCNVFVLKSSMAFCGDGMVLVVVVVVLKKTNVQFTNIESKTSLQTSIPLGDVEISAHSR